jgi:6-oxo-cyclohex-1-ene-carbonyl-CoA hydrolase
MSQQMRDFKNHDIVDDISKPGVRYEKRPAKRPDGTVAEGLYNVWITLDNPGQYNSYTTDMVKGVILAFRAASNARDVNCVVFTGAGDKAFCTGGNTKEYAEYYAGHPQEYRQYMRLFNDMVSAILACDKPVICRVNGMRIGGGQESAWPATSRCRPTWPASARPAPSTARPRSAAQPTSCRW